jgi:Mn2+/Fe2+ NRAMP family transporter
MLRVLGLAWIVMLADVDAASVVTAAQAGSNFGYAMLLPIVLLIPILYVIQEMTARLAICTGRGHAELIRDRFGVRWGAVAVVTMVAIDMLAYVAEFAGIVLGASLLGISAPVAVVGALVFHSAMVLTGSYRNFERMAVVLSLGLFAFVGLAVAARPDPAAIIGGLSPAQPFGRPGYLDLVVANIGAVIMPWMLFYQQAATVDKGLGLRDLRACRAETLIGAIASELLMAAIVIAAAAGGGSRAGTRGGWSRASCRPRGARAWRDGSAHSDRHDRLGPARRGGDLAVLRLGLGRAVPVAPQPQPRHSSGARVLCPVSARDRSRGRRRAPRAEPRLGRD